jgi:hypothetical protein
MRDSECDKVILNYKKRERSHKDLISYFKNNLLSEHYLAENYFQLTQKHVKGNLIKTDKSFMFKNEALNEVYIYKTPDGILRYADATKGEFELPYPVLSNELWPNKKIQERCYLSSNDLPIDILSLICANLRIKDILTLSESSPLLESRITKSSKCWQAHVKTLTEICPTLENLLKETPCFYDILKNMEEMFNCSKTFKQLENYDKKCLPFIFNLLFPAGKYITFFQHMKDGNMICFKNHYNLDSNVYRSKRSTSYLFELKIDYPTKKFQYGDVTTQYKRLLSCDAMMNKLRLFEKSDRFNFDIIPFLCNGTVYGCICRDYDKCERNCRLPGQYKLILPKTEYCNYHYSEEIDYDFLSEIKKREKLCIIKGVEIFVLKNMAKMIIYFINK